jgi:hypothetical protein
MMRGSIYMDVDNRPEPPGRETLMSWRLHGCGKSVQLNHGA